jgi:hypothetical protein
MINDLSNSLADRMVNLSPEVRAFCEENSRKIAGEPPRFQTMADAWVFAVLEGLKSGTRFEGELKKTKDAFRWRLVKNDFQAVLILRALLDQKIDESIVQTIQENPSSLLEHLERLAHQGVLVQG